jgi:hypothetical protein
MHWKGNGHVHDIAMTYTTTNGIQGLTPAELGKALQLHCKTHFNLEHSSELLYIVTWPLRQKILNRQIKKL